MNSTTLLTERYVYDLLKKDFDVFDRASLIKSYLKDTGLSQAQFCSKFGVPETTLHTWLLFGDRITKEEYNKMLSSGVSKTHIFKGLRGDKNVPSTDLEAYLEGVARKVREYKNARVKTTPVTYALIDSTVNELNNLGVELKLREKNSGKVVR